jgi:chemotaxis protein MotB
MSGTWKVAYADFMTAMMAFFLLMWILNMTPPETKQGLASYFAGERTFESSQVSPISNNPFIQQTDKIDTREFKITEVEKSHYAIAQKLKQMLMADAVPQSSTGISADDVGVQLRINSDVMFRPGTAELTPGAGKALQDVIALLREYTMYLVVRGHADGEEARPPYPSNWELSGARAAAVLRYLVDTGKIKATRLRGVAYADTRPVEPGIDEKAKAKNRRVEFHFHRPEVMSYSIVY